ncbi:RNA polymerase sigma factor [Bacteroides sp. 214]|uniref:RNA polymerase sigma factor n=1 Tax=Bacteroides sp. 214 TaxID=2302935 RepID=UPI0013D4414E|nr:RNA polymerase sigma factor [Bacteroides sp. 214]NDW13735.1 RNA polymerase sigma factor [Bacteroides sp. 214]
MHELKEFKHTILPLRDKLFRIALRITCNREEAEDIVQDVMLKMWQMKEQWNTIQSKEAYCCMMTRNLSFSRLALKDNQTENVEIELPYATHESSPLQILEKVEERELLRKFIGKLPEKEKASMELRDLEGMNYKEISETLQLTESQVKTHLFRGRKKIKEWFQHVI